MVDIYLRDVNTSIQAHLDEAGTTLCWLLKITGVDGTVLGVTSLERDVDYDDGAGVVTYQAAIGVQPGSMEASSDLSVDNSEGLMLLADAGAFTKERIEAGALDYGKYIVYRVNWADLSQGHYIPPNGVGTVGIVKRVDGVSATIELRALSQSLKQNYGELYSLTCRAVFGSGADQGSCAFAGSCGFDAESLWQNHSVASVGAEVDRIFTADSAPTVNGPNSPPPLPFVPGLIQWLTGNNAGHTSEVESVNGAVITLRFGTAWDIEATDTFKIRPDCDKTQESCINLYDNFLNFRGEPLIPMGDESSAQTPGASGVIYVPPPGEDFGEPPTNPPAEPPPPPPTTPPPTSTAINNPSFESGDVDWTKGVGWSITENDARTGTWAAELYSAGVPSPITHTYRAPVTGTPTVTASCYVKSMVPASVGARVFLNWYDADNVWISTAYGNNVTSASFAQSSVVDTAPAGAAFVTLGAQSQTSEFGHQLFADDFAWNL